MKISKRTWAAALAWAALISVAGRGDWAACWLALATITFAPLALAILAALAPRKAGLILAVDAEALAWSQAEPPGPRKPTGQPAEAARASWRPQPLSA